MQKSSATTTVRVGRQVVVVETKRLLDVVAVLKNRGSHDPLTQEDIETLAASAVDGNGVPVERLDLDLFADVLDVIARR